jgi:predicted Ser/Thr protein kinase
VARIGRYELCEEIARGGMGVVYRARDMELGADVAIKVLLERDPEELARFRREAEATKCLRHPNVVSVHGLGLHEGRPYLVMELIRGESLQQRIQRRGPLRTAEAVRVLEGVARAVAAAHAAGILHRDLKPHNVLLEGERILLTDFGVARTSASTLTQTGEVLGTPGYMAPEQAAGKRKDWGPLLDVYGLGATLYAALCGRAPFQAPSALATLDQVLNGRLASLKEQGADVDREIEALCLRCLARDPGDRPEAASDVADALEAWTLNSRAPRRGGSWFAGAAALFLVGGLGMLAGRGSVGSDPSPTPSQVDSPVATAKAGPEARPSPGSEPASEVDLGQLRAELDDRVQRWELVDARRVADEGLRAAPRDGHLLANSAWVHVLEGEIPAAERDLEVLAELEPADAPVALRWAQTLWLLADRTLRGKRQDLRERAIRLARSVPQGPEQAGTLALLLRIRKAPGDKEQAKRLLDMQGSHPLLEFARALHFPGAESGQLAPLSQRLKILRAARIGSEGHGLIELELARTLAHVAQRLGRKGRTDDALRLSAESLEVVEKARKSLPHDGLQLAACGWVHKERGNLLWEGGQKRAARAAYVIGLGLLDEAVGRLPNVEYVVKERSWCRALLKDVRALDDLERLESLSGDPDLPRRVRTLRILVTPLVKGRKRREILAILARSPAAVEEDPFLRLYRARANRMSYAWEAAFRDLSALRDRYGASKSLDKKDMLRRTQIGVEIARGCLEQRHFLGRSLGLAQAVRDLRVHANFLDKQPNMARFAEVAWVLLARCQAQAQSIDAGVLDRLIRRGGATALMGRALSAGQACLRSPTPALAQSAAQAYALVLEQPAYAKDPYLCGGYVKHLLSAGQAPRALSVVNAALSPAPRDAYLLFVRAMTQISLGDHSAALADSVLSFEQVASPRVLTLKCLALVGLGRADAAQETVEALEKLEIKDPALLAKLRRAVAKLRSK